MIGAGLRTKLITIQELSEEPTAEGETKDTAIDLAKEGKFDEARETIKKAADAMAETHEVQTQMIRDEMSGKAWPVSLIMVHAQDHLNLALIMRDVAEEFLTVHEKLKALEARIECSPSH